MVVYEGVPGPEVGHELPASSFFDRMWAAGKKTKRYTLFLGKAPAPKPPAQAAAEAAEAAAAAAEKAAEAAKGAASERSIYAADCIAMDSESSDEE